MINYEHRFEVLTAKKENEQCLAMAGAQACTNNIIQDPDHWQVSCDLKQWILIKCPSSPVEIYLSLLTGDYVVMVEEVVAHKEVTVDHYRGFWRSANIDFKKRDWKDCEHPEEFGVYSVGGVPACNNCKYVFTREYYQDRKSLPDWFVEQE